MGVHRFYCGCACGGRDIFRLCNVRHEGVRRAQTAALAPPPWLFPVVWTILFVLMGISAARIYIIGKQDRSGKKVRCGDNSDIGGQAACALRVYLVQLILNMLWTPLFFTLNLRFAAFVLLVMLLITVIVMTCRFFKLDKVSGILMLPYIAWLLFAGYLNLGTYILNG